MRLSKLKLAGFKSFVDPTTVVTPGQLVGIVGPNGCGKSNLIDAVRWVLGESRASALRGESMQDVIFNGSNTRKPISRASVELIFDNAAGKAAGQWSQYAEIAVKRVVDRDGGSDYFINGVKVRRKDVIDLFLGTGLGPRAYAIIEQGMISRVIEARPEEVRAFLEEAAGITKYKERRRETEGRLADARDNLARIEDIRAELGHQIDRLGSQAEVARRYKELQTALNERQGLLWTYKREQARLERERSGLEIARLGQQVEHDTERLRVLENQLAAARETHTRMGEVVGAAQGDVYAIGAEVSRIENALKTLREQHARLGQRIAQLGSNESDWRSRAAQLEADRLRWLALQEAAEQRVELARARQAEAQDALPAIEQAHRDALQRLDTLRREHALSEQQARVDDTRHQASLRALEALTQRHDRLLAERAAFAAEARPDVAAEEARVAELTELAEQHKDGLARGQTALNDAQHAVQATAEAERHAARKVTETRARLTALESLQARLRDQGDRAKWLASAGLNGLPELWQALEVEPGWELAVEATLRERIAALGPLANGIPRQVFDSAVPGSLVLLRGKAGAPGDPPAFDATPLARYVRSGDATLQAYLESWLAGIYAVEHVDAFLADTPLPQGVRLVTRSGAILDAQELALFAPDARTHGVVERQREITQLSGELAQLEEAHDASRLAQAQADDALRAAQEHLGTTRRQLNDAQQRLHDAQLVLLRAQEQLARHQERDAKLAGELQEIARAMETERAHLEAAEQGRGMHAARGEQLLADLDTAQEAMAEREHALRDAREQVQTLTRAAQEAEFALRECVAKLDEIARNEALIGEQLGKGEAELAQLIAERDGLDEDSLQTSLRTALDLRQAREAALAARREEQEEIARRIREMDEERLRCEHGLHPLREQLAQARLAQQAAELATQQAEERLAELHPPAREYAREELAQVKEGGLVREVSRLNREIEELGAVNLAALDELSAASERKSFLDAQYDDLMRAIETLEDAIRRIDRETREQLQNTYTTVNHHFGELFPRLFGGGEASLVLTGDEILDAGVQIVARPPGKKNSSIHLLSGGEKALTAIALVFAMFQLNPAPFCMLDEVDAPLDDANTERYCEMVKAMSSVTQFVFISHSKITMEMARQLVGVTMQEQGVSRVVEVDIDEALRLAQPEAA